MLLFENISNKSFMFKDCYSLESFSQSVIASDKTNNSQQESINNITINEKQILLFPWINNQKIDNDEDQYSSSIEDYIDYSDVVQENKNKDSLNNSTLLDSYDILKLNYHNIIDISYMFDNSKRLTSLNVSRWDTTYVDDMS